MIVDLAHLPFVYAVFMRSTCANAASGEGYCFRYELLATIGEHLLLVT